jgi:hypothetical protein
MYILKYVLLHLQCKRRGGFGFPGVCPSVRNKAGASGCEGMHAKRDSGMRFGIYILLPMKPLLGQKILARI